ncbi:MAG TPA: SpoIIE family protein phosphatase [Myxococcota bacterium]|nr:SpoIIE family protein phosphatase [Myxococcota bacterium]
MASRGRTLESKFLIVAGLGLTAGLFLTVAVSVFGAGHLGERSSLEIERGLTAANRDLVKKSLDDTTHAIDQLIDATLADLDVLTDLSQALVDSPRVLAPVDPAQTTPQNTYEFAYNADSGLYQSKPGRPAVIGVFDINLGPDKRPTPEVARLLELTAPLDDALVAVEKNGTSTLQVYYVGPHEAPIMRLAPYVDIASVFAKLYPASRGQNFWDFFFTGIVEHWVAQTKDRATFEQKSAERVMWPPYEDAGGGGLIVTFFRPVWTPNRDDLASGIGIDVTLSDLVKAIAGARLGEAGFSFLIEANTNVLAVSEAGERALGLRSEDGGKAGLRLLTRFLGKSSAPSVAALATQLPRDGETHFHETTLSGEPYVTALRKSRSFFVMRDGKVQEESWTLGVAIPHREIFGPLLASQEVVQSTSRSVIIAQVGIAALTLLAVLLGIKLLTRRMTAPLAALTEAATQIRQRNYDVTLPATHSTDEIAELTTAFSAMAADSRDHTKNLEALVSQRTADLNRTLAELWSEMDLARKVQTVLLPDDADFAGYDIAALMLPAANVGGDYYDYFRLGDAQWLLVGDVSGHGVSSGLIMMMAQTAVRATTHTLNQRGVEVAPSEVLALVNAAIRSNLGKIGHDQYMTVTALRLEKTCVRYAGLHQDILVFRRATGQVERIETDGVWVGLLDDITPFLRDAELTLNPGDVMLLHTDGLTEARHEGRMLGLETLERAFSEAVVAHPTHAKSIVEGILGRLPVTAFDDDITLVAVTRTES